MFEGDLTTLSTRDLLESCAETHAAEHDAAARQLEHAVEYADRFSPDTVTDHKGRDGRERAVVLGGDGCPPIMEFCVSEFGVVMGVSPGVARDRIGTALALRSRFPFIWARILDRTTTPWKARNLARDCEKLSLEAALYVDRRVADLLDTITPHALAKIVKAAKMHADPDQARAEAAAKVRERGVFIGRSDEHGTKTIYIRTSTGAATRFDAAIHALADAQHAIGDTRPTQTRRADAVGIIADPVFTQELLNQAQTHPSSDTPSPGTSSPATSDAPPEPHDSSPTPAPASAEPPAPHAPATHAPAPSTSDAAAAPAAANTSSPATSNAERPASRDARPAPAKASSDTSAPQAPAPEATPETSASPNGLPADRRPAEPGPRQRDWATDDWNGDLPECEEPGLDDEADRDAPHPSSSELPDPLDRPERWLGRLGEPLDHLPCPGSDDDDQPMDRAARDALTKRLAQIKHDAYARHASTAPGTPGAAVRPGKAVIYIHITDQTLAAAATRDGVVRAEGIGPLLTSQATELIGYAPYIIKPVIDLNNTVSVNCYEATERIRERIKLTHPVELFPYGTRETSHSIDLDHITPYDPSGPPGQTNTQNLAPLGRYGHRVKTHAHGWKAHRINPTTLEWTTPHGFVVHVNPTGTHRINKPEDATPPAVVTPAIGSLGGGRYRGPSASARQTDPGVRW